MDTVKFRKLDARFRGYPDFQWMAEAPRYGSWAQRVTIFSEIRRWCWENFGPSDEYDIWYYVGSESRNPDWSWNFVNGKMRIYLNDKSYSWAILKWQQ